MQKFVRVLAALVFLMFPSWAQAGPPGDPIVIFLDGVETQITKLVEVGELYFSEEQAEKIAMENLKNGSEMLIKKLAKTPLKELDVSLIEAAAKQLHTAAAELLKFKAGDTKRRAKIMPRLGKAHRVLSQFPVMTWLRARYEILKAEKWLEQEKYSPAETSLNRAYDMLDVFSVVAPKKKDKTNKDKPDELSLQMKSAAGSTIAFLEDYLIYVRRNEPMPPRAFSKTQDGIAKSYSLLWGQVQERLQ